MYINNNHYCFFFYYEILNYFILLYTFTNILTKLIPNNIITPTATNAATLPSNNLYTKLIINLLNPSPSFIWH